MTDSWVYVLLSLILIGVLVILWWGWKLSKKADELEELVDDVVSQAKNAIRMGSKKSVTDLLHEGVLAVSQKYQSLFGGRK